jgi:anhydro-N-acetylmuramic acid kinase
VRAIGLMSGTSLDGIDVALIETDGEAIFALGPVGYRPYGDEERAVLAAAIAAGAGLTDRRARPGVLQSAEGLVTAAHAEAVETFLAEHGIDRAGIDVVGFHGQTVSHRPADRLTVQIGDGEALAERLGLTVVHDFRAADVAAGGQGAPLVPVFHRALAQRLWLPRPLAILNVGGVANVTFIGAEGELIAFDTGPGNAPIDDLMRIHFGRAFDEDGATAARGRVDGALLAWLLTHPYLQRRPPKSLDRLAFGHGLVAGLAPQDAVATMAAFAGAAAARALDFLAAPPLEWVVVGGGARNPAIMAALARHTGGIVRIGAEAGLMGDYVEAQAFAYLAARSLHGLPITFPETTGISHAMSGGVRAEP